MADISKINGVPIANIEKLDAVLAANIAKVNGLTFALAPAVPSPAAAYSVRLLDSAVGISSYTGAAMRVRRETAGGTGDDDEADIAFDSGVISLDSAISNASALVTATTLGQFLNVGTVNGTTYTNPDSLTVTASCFVDEWKDQSGNANHAEQTTQSSQFTLHDGTTNSDLILKNGKPALLPTSNAVGFNAISVDLTNSDVSSFMVGESNNNFAVSAQFDTSLSEWILLAHANNTDLDGAIGGGLNAQNATCHFNGVAQTLPITRGAVHTQFRDNQTLASLINYSGVSANTINIENIANFFRVFVYQEIIFYKSDQSTNRTGIESDINTYFSIYT